VLMQRRCCRCGGSLYILKLLSSPAVACPIGPPSSNGVGRNNRRALRRRASHTEWVRQDRTAQCPSVIAPYGVGGVRFHDVADVAALGCICTTSRMSPRWGAFARRRGCRRGGVRLHDVAGVAALGCVCTTSRVSSRRGAFARRRGFRRGGVG